MTTPTLREELRAVLNRHSAENASDTPDFVLAEYVMSCIGAFDSGVRRREAFYGRGTAAFCVCGEPSKPGVVHRPSNPCYVARPPSEPGGPL